MELSMEQVIAFHPDTVEAVRKEFNLDKPGRMDEAIDILDDWVKKQEHFVKKDFSRDYLERTIIRSKGLVEGAKQRLDKLCTMRTLMPNIFQYTDTKELYEKIKNYISFAPTPQLTKEHCRLHLYKIHSDEILLSSNFINFLKVGVAVCELFKAYDYCSRYIVVLDITEVNIVSLAARMNIMELRQAIMLVLEGYGFRIKGIHIITSSKTVEVLLPIIKKILSAKLVNRLHVHKSTESLYEYVPKEIMPRDFGGDEKPLSVIRDQWMEFICAKEHVEYLKEMNRATTKESYRSPEEFNSQYLGTPGSFRSMVLD